MNVNMNIPWRSLAAPRTTALADPHGTDQHRGGTNDDEDEGHDCSSGSSTNTRKIELRCYREHDAKHYLRDVMPRAPKDCPSAPVQRLRCVCRKCVPKPSARISVAIGDDSRPPVVVASASVKMFSPGIPSTDAASLLGGSRL